MHELYIRGDNLSSEIREAYDTILLDQLDFLKPIKSTVPSNSIIDRRLFPILTTLCFEPNIKMTLKQFSQMCGASERTLNRLFIINFNMSFREWRNIIVMEKAKQMVKQGYRATDIAIELGYSNLSAYSIALKKYQP
jgi:AraC-like DNA-binding protein